LEAPDKIAAGSTLLLTSDAYLRGNWRSCCRAVISRPVSFRSLTFQTDKDTNYADRPSRSERYNLVQRGSLLYVKDDEQQAQQLSEHFKQEAGFRQIGYNYFTTV
jgi:hypothetical protein